MPDLMADGAAWLAGQLADNLSQTVSLKRGNTAATTGVKATKCPIASEFDGEQGIVEFDRCDWIIGAEKYVIGGVAVEPADNDLITESGGDVWQVLAQGGNEQGHRPFDQFGNAWRVHTKRVTDG